MGSALGRGREVIKIKAGKQRGNRGTQPLPQCHGTRSQRSDTHPDEIDFETKKATTGDKEGPSKPTSGHLSDGTPNTVLGRHIQL